jgi:hypothetical protein
MRLIRVVAKHFVAGFETDGVVRRAAPILKKLIGQSDDTARKVIAQFGWKASVIDEWDHSVANFQAPRHASHRESPMPRKAR